MTLASPDIVPSLAEVLQLIGLYVLGGVGISVVFALTVALFSAGE
jgi:hypothetical protein